MRLDEIRLLYYHERRECEEKAGSICFDFTISFF